jgi:hypothetical protein
MFMVFFSGTCAWLAYSPQAFAEDKKTEDKKAEDKKEDKKVEHDPKSNNKDKIVGKWKFTEFPPWTGLRKEDYEAMTKVGIYIYFEFTADGVMVMGLGGDTPETLKFLKDSTPDGKITCDAKYKLLAGDGVEVYDLPRELQQQMFYAGLTNLERTTQVKLAGDKMTMTHAEGGRTGKLARVKEEKKDK